MNNLIEDLATAITSRWPESETIPGNNLPHHVIFPIAVMIIQEENLWFISVIAIENSVLLLAHSRVRIPENFDRDNFSFDAVGLSMLNGRFTTNFISVHYTPDTKVYKTEFHNHQGEVIAVDACGVENLVDHIAYGLES